MCSSRDERKKHTDRSAHFRYLSVNGAFTRKQVHTCNTQHTRFGLWWWLFSYSRRGSVNFIAWSISEFLILRRRNWRKIGMRDIVRQAAPLHSMRVNPREKPRKNTFFAVKILASSCFKSVPYEWNQRFILCKNSSKTALLNASEETILELLVVSCCCHKNG